MTVEANVAKGDSLKSKPKRKEKKNKELKAPILKKKKIEKEGSKLKEKCFHCGKDEHWKRNFFTYLAEKQKEKEGNNDK